MLRSLVLALVLVLAGGVFANCSTPQQNSPSVTPTETATPAVVPIPILTPAPTITPTATAIPVPSVNPTSTATTNPTPTSTPTTIPVVPSIVGPTHINWVKIGEARNGEEVLALPIPWDQVIRDRAKADPRILAWLDQINRPIEDTGPGELIGYLLKDDRVVVYSLADPAKSGVSYWKAEIPLDELKGLRP